ncbi:MAG: ATP-binding cassette domain-containing protein [Thermoleophilaceae bacterium]|nr:ATP-binding cassette domain-containing protein [Thermoleophilaceae bacterium]
MAAVEIHDLHKRFGSVAAVKGLSFEVAAGRVTGFLGPNGAGKSTTLRALLGLVHPTSGTATFGGQQYEELERPSAQVGAVLEDASFHPGRTARNHLRVLAVAGEHPASRVEEVLTTVGLADTADRRVSGYSMGMRQRLAIASALVGDPQVLILDEPTNGLDPPGISWMRTLLRHQAEQGRTVLVSSHLLAEVAQSVDDVVVISNGELRGSGPLEQVLGAGGDGLSAEVRARDSVRLHQALERRGYEVARDGEKLHVTGAGPEDVGLVAAEEQLALTGLAPRSRSLETAFFELTGGES